MKHLKYIIWLIVTVIVLVVMPGRYQSITANTNELVIPNHRPIPKEALFKGRLPAANIVKGTLHFQVQQEAELEKLLQEQQDSQSANYHKWLTPVEFGRQFGIPNEVYQQTLAWLKANGLVITQTWPNQLRIDFQGTTAEMEATLGTEVMGYEMAGESYYASSSSMHLPPFLSPYLLDINVNKFRLVRPVPPQVQVGASGRVTLGPQDLYVAYNFNPLLNAGFDGRGQSIGIVARSDFDVEDVNKYRAMFNLPSASLVKVPSGGTIVNRGGLEELEVLLDAQLSGAAAPRASVQVVIADQDSDIDQSLAFLVNQLPETKIISISFTECETFLFPSFEALFHNLYKQAVAQGQTVLVASGDDGVNACFDSSNVEVNALAASPFVVGVGGTSLNVGVDDKGNVTSYRGERGWSGSGGGVSFLFPRPDFQRSLTIAGMGRAVPDVALIADPGQPGFLVVQSGLSRVIGGTSTSSPVWAGILALTNQFSQTAGLGNANSRLYQLGAIQQKGGVVVFNDVVQGDNSSAALDGFMAQPGYDLVTGWGSPNVDSLVRNFTTVPDRGQKLLLVMPNGREIYDKGETISIKWRISPNLVPTITSQDIFISTDAGANFKLLTSKLSADSRSFDFKPQNLTTATARFRLVAHTNSGMDLVDSSDLDVNIGTNLRIEFAEYVAIDKRLNIIGDGLTAQTKLIVNGKPLALAAKVTPTGLTFRGKAKKLKLIPGENFITVEVDGLPSAIYRLFLAS